MSSLEDLDSKYNVQIERGVMLEADIHAGEAEREGLRIEVQRLRDELSDLKVEAEITQEKLQNALVMNAKYGGGGRPGYQSPISEDSTSDVIPSTPRNHIGAAKSSSSDVTSQTPPSPPISETSTTASGSHRGPNMFDPSMTPRPSHFQKIRHSQASTVGGSNSKPSIPVASSSRSLTQIRGLIGQMQRLEQRVHSARSKLPAPATSPPNHSPHATPAPHQHYPNFMSNSLTMRSQQRKSRPSSNISSSSADTAVSPSPSSGPVSRLSFGGMGDRPSSRPTAQSGPGLEKLEQLMQGIDRSRPSSRASAATSTASKSSFGGSATASKPSFGGSAAGSKLSFGGSATSSGTSKVVGRGSNPSGRLAQPSNTSGRLAPPSLKNRNYYTTNMKTSLTEANPRNKKSTISLNKDWDKDKEKSLGIASDDECDDIVESKPKPTLAAHAFATPTRRSTLSRDATGGLSGIPGLSGFTHSPKPNLSATLGLRSALPRRSLAGDRRVSTGSALGGPIGKALAEDRLSYGQITPLRKKTMG